MNKYGQYCPMARAVEILGDRWTLLIVRDLHCGVEHFNALARGLPGIPKGLLSQRLRRLQQTGIVERQVSPDSHATRYRLTQAGQELHPIIDSLTQWGAKWAFGEPEPAELNPVLLLWWMRGRVCLERLPAQRVVVEFKFQEVRPSTYWLVLKPEDVSLCVTHPGFEIDVLVIAELSAFYQVWLGRISFDQAVREQRVEIEALPSLARAFPNWFALSPAAETVRAEARQLTVDRAPGSVRLEALKAATAKPPDMTGS